MAEGETLGHRVTRLREQMGWDKRTLAAKAGVHPTHIGLIERAVRVDVRYETLQKLAGAFGITVEQLLGQEEIMPVVPDAVVPDDLELLESYRQAIQAARDNGLDPDQLLQLINTTAALFIKK